MALRKSRLKSSLPKTATLKTQRETPAGNGAAPVGAPEAGPRRSGDIADRTTTTKRRIHRRVTPFELIQLPIQVGMRRVLDLRRLLIVLALTVGVLLLPTPEGLTPEGHRALALFVFAGSILALEPAPLPIAALMVPVAQIALNIDSAQGAFAPFGQPVIFLILGSLFLAEALRKHGLTRRLGLYSIVYSRGRFPLLLFGLMGITGLLSMWVLNTAMAAVLIPVAVTIAQRVPHEEQARKVLAMLILGIAYAASMGGIATVMGSGEIAIAADLLAQVTPFGFVDWLQIALPVSLILIPLNWFLLRKAIRLPDIVIDTAPASTELTRLGPLRGPEIELILVMLVSVVLWVLGPTVEEWLGLPPSLLSSAVVAVGAVAVLSFDEVIDWNDLRGVNWGIFFVIGAGLTLGDALGKTGASDWFASMVAPALRGLSYPTVLTILVATSFVLTQILNNVTLGAILAPVLISLAQASGLPPTAVVMPSVVAIGLAYLLPVSSSRMSLVAVTGAVERSLMIRTGLFVGIPSAIVVLLYFLLLYTLGVI